MNKIVWTMLSTAFLGAVAILFLSPDDKTEQHQPWEPTILSSANHNGITVEIVYLEPIELKWDNSFSLTFKESLSHKTIATQVTIASDSNNLFKTDESEISNKQTLDNIKNLLGDYVKALPDSMGVLVVGHTDKRGNPHSNALLSERRAMLIANLLKDEGINTKAIFFEGVGDKHPIANNNTKTGRAKNRRIELIAFFKDKPSIRSLNEAATDISVAKHRTQTTEEHLPSSRRSSTLQLLGKKLSENSAKEAIKKYLGRKVHDNEIVKSLDPIDEFDFQTCASTPITTGGIVVSLDPTSTKPSIFEGIPSLIGNSWYGKPENGKGKKSKTMVVVSAVHVNKKTMRASGPTEISFYKKYTKDKLVPDKTYKVRTEVYEGNNAILYRIYPTSLSAEFDCADFIFRTNGEKTSPYGHIVYTKNGTQMLSTIQLRTAL